MKGFFWKLKYSYLFWRRVRWTFKQIWQNANSSYGDVMTDKGPDLNPGQAVDEEIEELQRSC